MSGDNTRNDDSDFLGDDFVVEDLAGKNDGLDQLFDPAAPPPPSAATPPAEDADDVLFQDHTKDLSPSEKFAADRTFDEKAATTWRGDGLDLDEVGVPSAEPTPEQVAAAESAFTEELGGMLQNEDEFGLDSENELEVVGAAPADGVTAIEQSGPFVLDDGDGAWQEEAQEDALRGATGAGASTDAEAAEESVAAPELVEDEHPIEPGWEPLPGTSVDALAEVDGVARVDGEQATAGEPSEESAEELVGAGVGAQAMDAAEGHDIYANEAAPVLVGPRSRTGHQAWRLLGALAATLLLIGGAAVVVMRPEWVGLSLAPARVEQIQLERPSVHIAVAQPPAVALSTAPSGPTVAQNGGDPANPVATGGSPRNGNPAPNAAPTTTGTAPTPSGPTGSNPTTVPGPGPAVPDVPAPGATSTGPVAAPTNPEAPVAGPGPVPVAMPSSGAGEVSGPAVPSPAPGSMPAATTGPVAVTPGPGDVVTSPEPPAPAATEPARPDWPVATATPLPSETKPRAPAMVRIGENLMLGEVTGPTASTAQPVDGVLPGTRAFAQLRNGNYFIGSVKVASSDRLTLRINEGEVTLAADDIARLTELGSADYEQLQKATSGFIRLTNNNRLVGGILSEIADDHVVLEFRSNRVMLPKSAVGQVVKIGEESDVRLDVTREEDDWVRGLAERELGTGKGVEPKAKQKPAGIVPTPVQAPAAPRR